MEHGCSAVGFHVTVLEKALHNSFQCTLYIPVDIRRRLNLYKTSIQLRRRRIDVLWTLKRLRVSSGMKSRERLTWLIYVEDLS